MNDGENAAEDGQHVSEERFSGLGTVQNKRVNSPMKDLLYGCEKELTPRGSLSYVPGGTWRKLGVFG